MTTLTEQWKKGKLPDGWYYVKVITEFEYPDDIAFYTGEYFELYSDEEIEQVLAPLPSYEEWQASEKYNKHLEEVIKIYKRKDKQATETSIAYNELAEENTKLKTDCKTLAHKLLQVKPELRDWLEVNFKEYL